MENKFISDKITDYCQTNSTPLPLSLQNILIETVQMPNGHMNIGLISSMVLRFFLLLKRPLSILEIGTFTGFTLALFDEYSSFKTHIVSVEENEDLYQILLVKFANKIKNGKLTIVKGDGIKYLSENRSQFDFIFIDARKDSYFDKINLLYDSLNKNGVLIVDNALAGLSVFNPTKPWHAQTRSFNESLCNDARFITTILPLRDGFTLSIKK